MRAVKGPESHDPRTTVLFVDGYEHHDIIPDKFAHQLVDTYRADLTGQKR